MAGRRKSRQTVNQGRKHKQQEENVNTDGGGEKSQQLTNEDEASIELTKVKGEPELDLQLVVKGEMELDLPLAKVTPMRRSKRIPKMKVIPDTTMISEDFEMFDDEVQDRNFVIQVEDMSPSSDRQSAETQKAEKQKVKQKVVSIPCPAENGRDMKRDMGELQMIAGDHFRQHICSPRSEENEKYKQRVAEPRKKQEEHRRMSKGPVLELLEKEYDIPAEKFGESAESVMYRPERSKENEKYKEVYATIPKLRSVSPPRFSTKGVVKKKIDCKELGVKKIGKTKGNPYSKFHMRRNGVVFGNQTLDTVEEELKYTVVATNIKNVLRSQTTTVRLSSYVQPELLKKAREQNVKTTRRVRRPKIHDEGDVDIDVDIETIDDSYVDLEPETEVVKPKRKMSNRGRKPGKTILECEECGYKTTHSGHMKIHIVCVHKDIKMLECQYSGCDYKCARKGSMTRHEKCVHRKDQVFKCQQCDFHSAWSISLERHIITRHEKLKPWSCTICSQSFGQQFTLTQHINTVHKKLKRVLCAFCDFRASTKVSVRSHILRKHKDEIEQAINESDEEPEQES